VSHNPAHISSSRSRHARAVERERELQLQAFLSECTVKSPGHRVQSSNLHAAYEAWARSKGLPPLSIALFALALKRIDQQALKCSTIWWLNLKLAADRTPTAAAEALEHAWRSASPNEALGFLLSKLRALGIDR
jgi:hypothetical protein